MIIKIFKSIQYSIHGLFSCFKMEASFRLEFLLFLFTAISSYVLNLTVWKGLILLICVTLIMIVELLNSGIEKLADLITTEKNPLVAYAKDAGSAAVFLMHIIYFGLLVFFIVNEYAHSK